MILFPILSKLFVKRINPGPTSKMVLKKACQFIQVTRVTRPTIIILKKGHLAAAQSRGRGINEYKWLCCRALCKLPIFDFDKIKIEM